MTDNYDVTQAGVQMTLASIAYADQKDITTQLANKNYATKDEWRLVWGPVIGSYGDNLVYVAQNQPDPTIFAIVLRGTVIDVRSILEDIPTGQGSFSSVMGSPTLVSNHFLDGLNGMLSVTDSNTGKDLENFLLSKAANANNLTVYVTGHSQGGALTPMMLACVMQWSASWTNTGTNELVGYAFAPPTSGDPGFADWISTKATSFQVINPLDIVPCSYASILDLISNEIPIKPDWEWKLVIEAAAEAFKLVGAWRQPETKIKLNKVQLPPSIGYLDQVGDQHNHNSYLYLLGAPQTDVGDPSVLPNY